MLQNVENPCPKQITKFQYKVIKNNYYRDIGLTLSNNTIFNSVIQYRLWH